MPIGENIKRLRESRGLTQAQLGAIAGVSDKAVSTWESGTREPRMGAIEKISLHFGVPKSAILFGSEELIEKTAGPKVDGLSPKESELLTLYRGVNPDGQRYILQQAEFANSREEYRLSPAPTAKSGA